MDFDSFGMFLLYFVMAILLCFLGAVCVSERGQLADHRAKRKSKIAITKYNKNIPNESKSKNRFPYKSIQRDDYLFAVFCCDRLSDDAIAINQLINCF